MRQAAQSPSSARFRPAGSRRRCAPGRRDRLMVGSGWHPRDHPVNGCGHSWRGVLLPVGQRVLEALARLRTAGPYQDDARGGRARLPGMIVVLGGRPSWRCRRSGGSDAGLCSSRPFSSRRWRPTSRIASSRRPVCSDRPRLRCSVRQAVGVSVGVNHDAVGPAGEHPDRGGRAKLGSIGRPHAARPGSTSGTGRLRAPAPTAPASTGGTVRPWEGGSARRGWCRRSRGPAGRTGRWPEGRPAGWGR
jgi:hypothetical protein